MVTSLRRALACGLFSSTAISGLVACPAAAQDKPQAITPLEVAADPTGLNILTGKVLLDANFGISIPAAPRLSYRRGSDYKMYIEGREQTFSPLEPGTEINPDEARASYAIHTGGLQSESFYCSPNCIAEGNSGSQLIGATNLREYTQEKSAAVYQFGSVSEDQLDTNTGVRTTRHYASTITYPDGEQLSLQYDIFDPNDPIKNHRTKQVDSNTGYSLIFEYWTAVAGQGASGNWDKIKSVSLVKTANPATALGKLTYTLDGTQVTDLAGRTWTCSSSCGSNADSEPWRVSGTLNLPTETTPARQVNQSSNHYFLAQSVIIDGVPWNYSYSGVRTSLDGTRLTYAYGSATVTGPDGYNQVYKLSSWGTGSGGKAIKNEYITESTDSLNRKTVYDYQFDYGLTWTSHRLKSITYPEGNSVHLLHDGANNIVKRTEKAKPGSGLSDIVMEANYTHGGTAPALKWQPAWIDDARGARTDFSYTAQGLLEQQLDPTMNGTRKRTFIEYEAPGQNGSATYRKSKVRTCEVSAASPAVCITPEPFTTFQYLGATSLPTTISEVNPADGLTRTTVTAYDDAGRALSVDGPMAGTADAVYFRYDQAGRKDREIGAADDAGRRLAKRFTYRAADDKVTQVETGYVTSHDAANFAQIFTTANTDFDSRRNPVREQVSADGTVHAVTSRSFNDRGSPVCTTTRMNPASWGGIADACTHTTAGANGPDRVTKNLYDAAAQLLQVREGVGTSVDVAEATFDYTPNGKKKFVVDANGNKAELVYNGHDRQSRWVFPSTTRPSAFNNATPDTALTSAGAVNPNDFEEYAYDANGNRTSHRKRDGSTLTFQYDALNRMTLKVVPERGGLSSIHTRDVHYGYDYRGLQTFARFDSPTGQGVTTNYDGFGRATSSSINLGGITRTLDNQHNLSGSRTELTYPDNVKMSFAHDGRKRMTSIFEGPLGSGGMLANFAYNNRGPRQSLTSRGGDTTSYAYDGLSRLQTLGDTFVGGAGNSQSTFGHNPASQIIGLTRNNDAYAHLPTNQARGYQVNGLNQYTSAGGLTQAHDANGNLTSDGAITYIYDIENRMVAASNGATLTYDPVGRLFETSGTSTGSTQFLYDGDELVGEYDGSGGLTKRYVHGSGVDDPVVWYEGSTLSTPRYLHTDHQGSVTSMAKADGMLLNVNRYDEYGVAATSNIGRFGYTGQIWLPEVRAWYYKARVLRAEDGRFYQTDPVGFSDQFNLYAYVANDPLNQTDSTGMFQDSLERAIQRDDLAYLNGELTKEEYAERRQARGLGGVVGGALVVSAAIPTVVAPLIREAARRIEFTIARKVAEREGVKRGFNAPRKSDTGGMKAGDGKGNGIRVERGDPKAPFNSQRSPYVKETEGGKMRDSSGNEVHPTANMKPSENPVAHQRAWEWVRRTRFGG